MCTKIINDQLTDLFYNFIEMEDRIAANDRYADLNSSDMRFLSAVGKGVLGYDCLIDCSQIPMIEPFPKKWTRKMRKKQNEANRSE